MVIPRATKAAFPDAPVIVDPGGEVNNVVAAGVIQASIQNTKAHNEHIDNNLAELQDVQAEELERQNADIQEAWRECNGAIEPEPEKPKRRFGLF